MVKKTSLAAVAASVTTLVSASAFAQDAAGAAANRNDVSAMLALAAGFAIGIAVLGGALGQGRAAASALEGISRNPGAAPKIQTPMILGLALIESLVLFAFLIAFLLMGRIQLSKRSPCAARPSRGGRHRPRPGSDRPARAFRFRRRSPARAADPPAEREGRAARLPRAAAGDGAPFDKRRRDGATRSPTRLPATR